MIFTLHRYLFREQLRVFVLTTIALSMMLSMGLMLRPIQDYGVAPSQTLRLLGYFLPITLVFVLPMSALFAGALIYGRFAFENELDACRASGISVMTVILPGLFLSLLISIATLVLSFYVAPNFVHRAERAVKANAKQILFRNLQRKGFYDIEGRWIVYADRADPAHDMIYGVIIVEVYHDRVRKFITAESAKILIDSKSQFNEITVVASQTRQIDEFAQFDSGQLSFTGRFPPLLADNVKFQTIDQIKRIRANPLEFYPTRTMALKVRTQLAGELLGSAILQKMNKPEDYFELVGEDRIVLMSVHAVTPADKDIGKLLFDGPIRLLELDPDRQNLTCQWDCQSGYLYFDGDSINAPMDLVLDSPSWDRGGGVKGIAGKHVIKNLRLPDSIESQLTEDRLLSQIDQIPTLLQKPKPTRQLLQLRNQLRLFIAKTTNQIRSEVHSKLVLGLGCTTLILTGIALGIRFRGGHLLSAFGASSIPAAALIICILAGKDMAKNPAASVETGLLIMWCGLLALTILALVLYRKLTRT
ncbi:MAG: LptF/LptG family permease [Phycisphaerae bacterium]|nr:LptF/LptG family permease [Phycisphaerae bacterium]